MPLRPEELEAEAERTRARMTALLDELRQRVTPGQVIDQAIDYTRHGPPAELLHNLGREIRENPLPLALIVAGVAWLVIAASRSARAFRDDKGVPETSEDPEAIIDETAALAEDSFAAAQGFGTQGFREENEALDIGEEPVGTADWQRLRVAEPAREPR